jgi:drug/metabolite transporter (DMT)-like permease
MVNWLYLFFGVITAVAIWPISKWALQNNGDEKAVGFWNTSVISLVSLVSLIYMKANLFVEPVFYSAAITGVSYAVGFLIIMMYCLKIGPSGLTMTINNSSMIFAILYSIIVLNPHIPGLMVIIGIAGVLLSITLIGIADRSGSKAGYDYKKWFKYVIIGGLFSGVSFSNQAYMAYVHPGIENTLIFMFWANLVSSIILVIVSLYKKTSLFKKKEMIAGTSNSFFNLLGIIFTFNAIRIYGSELTFPVIVCLPIIIMLFVGRFIYNERFTAYSFSGAVAAVISILMLSVGS